MVKSTVISTWHIRRESPEHGFNYEYMEARLVEKGETGQTTRMVEFVYPSEEVKTYLVVTARAIWDTLISDCWDVYIPEHEKNAVAPQPKERLRRKKQRVKTAMTGFDKLKNKSNYALEA